MRQGATRCDRGSNPFPRIALATAGKMRKALRERSSLAKLSLELRRATASGVLFWSGAFDVDCFADDRPAVVGFARDEQGVVVVAVDDAVGGAVRALAFGFEFLLEELGVAHCEGEGVVVAERERDVVRCDVVQSLGERVHGR